MRVLVLVAAVLVGVPGAGTALHLGFLALGSLFYRSPDRAAPVPSVRFLVLVPAHNEARVLGATLAALNADRRPSDEILVVADRCTDATADIARAAGALVLERLPGDEPGRAAARQAGVRHALGLPWDDLVMIDADSIIEPGFFDACEAALASGAEALQARTEAAVGPRLLDQAALAAFALQGVLMPRGRDRLGLLVQLQGSGMVLSRRVVSQFQFRAPASEDLWYSLDLCLAGERPHHIEGARLRSLNVGSLEAAGSQRVRYEAGRMSAAREFVGPLLRRHDRASLEAAWYLLNPPYAVAILSLVLAIVLGALGGARGAPMVAWTAFGLLMLQAGALVVALLETKAGPRPWLALLVAPWYVPWKATIHVRAFLSVRRGVATYGATSRQ